jgi:methylated-DNA-[protein]-cysteine S-methyltransferase
MEGPTVLIAVMDAPWGPLSVAVSQVGVLAAEHLTPPAAFAGGVERRLGATIVERRSDASPNQRQLLDQAIGELRTYFGGDHREFRVPLDLPGRSPWDRAVLGGVRDIPYGSVTSYGRLARHIGRPRAARAAGGAVGRNPIAILVPCHRVIAGDGSLGGYGGDWYGTREQLLSLKRELLALEGVILPATRWADDPVPIQIGSNDGAAASTLAR